MRIIRDFIKAFSSLENDPDVIPVPQLWQLVRIYDREEFGKKSITEIAIWIAAYCHYHKTTI